MTAERALVKSADNQLTSSQILAVWPTLARFALCAGCRRAAVAMGMDLRAVAA